MGSDPRFPWLMEIKDVVNDDMCKYNIFQTKTSQLYQFMGFFDF